MSYFYSYKLWEHILDDMVPYVPTVGREENLFKDLILVDFIKLIISCR